jgi:hypothetical protein
MLHAGSTMSRPKPAFMKTISSTVPRAWFAKRKAARISDKRAVDQLREPPPTSGNVAIF